MSPPERLGDYDDTYWTADIAIGDGRFYDDRSTIRLALVLSGTVSLSINRRHPPGH